MPGRIHYDKKVWLVAHGLSQTLVCRTPRLRRRRHGSTLPISHITGSETICTARFAVDLVKIGDADRPARP